MSGWSRDRASCRGCRDTHRPHHARGYCLPCYNRILRGAGAGDPVPHGRWARAFAACRACGTEDVPHHAGGLCRRCYHQDRRSRGHPDRRRKTAPPGVS